LINEPKAERHLSAITSDLITRHGLTQDEYQKIIALLGREPNLTELGLFSVMWSEHCSYKSSRVFLKRLPTEAPHVIQGPGENAGVVDIGDGLAAVFKMESHNHPSFIEPYQGAATGVGGILRDVFTMGARPIALLDSLRFGSLHIPKNRYLFSGVVAGIAGYGNCVGVPTVGGEVYFNDIYSKNPLVNVMCLGIAPRNRIFLGKASGEGNSVLYVGAKTGRDGIHGATMASDAFDDESEGRRPTVQVGDPFTEKLLIECCLELMEQDLLIGIQDMGAAGLTSSSCEMAFRGGSGIELELSDVPRREPDMTPYEVLLSESQERMLLVAKPGCEEKVLETCRKWDLSAAVVGRVTGDGLLRVKENGRIVAEVPARALAADAPKYERPFKPPAYQDDLQALPLELIPEPKDCNRVLEILLSSPTIAHKGWVFEQYDHMVQTNTLVRPGADAAVLRIKGTQKALALTADCNSLYCVLNPYVGAASAVAEAARNLACVGARPLGLTDCLNFGNPERPDIMWQFALAIEGIADACNALKIPVVSGNVSFYNETNGLSIYPTPVIGMVGILEQAARAVTADFKAEGDVILLLGETEEDLGGTEYLRAVHHREQGVPPRLELEREGVVQEVTRQAIERGLLQSAHDCAEGGLAVTVAECALSPARAPIGAAIVLDQQRLRRDSILFGESQSRIVVSVKPENVDVFRRLAEEAHVPCSVLGTVGGDRLTVAIRDAEGRVVPCIDRDCQTLNAIWRGALQKALAPGVMEEPE
jgi:phosphoribosylformylglycinamidine synthase II